LAALLLVCLDGSESDFSDSLLDSDYLRFDNFLFAAFKQNQINKRMRNNKQNQINKRMRKNLILSLQMAENLL
jgi:hypothetical protein